MGEQTSQGVTCANCGYDLTGISRYGKCPECGSYYDKERGTGTSSNRSERMQRADRLLARVRTVLLVLAAAGVMGCGGLLTLIAKTPTKPLWIAGVIAVVLLMAAATSFFYERPD